MKLKIYKNSLISILILLPFVLVYIGSILTAFNKELSTVLKISAFLYMLSYVIIHQKFNRNLLFSTLLFLPLLLYGILISFNIKAGLTDGIRYLFPIIILFYSYSIKKHFKVLLAFIIVFVIINFITQLFN